MSLTSVAIITRKVVRYGLYGIIFLIVGKIAFDIGLRTYRRFFPEPPPPATVSFGKLPTLPFPDREKIPFSFVLETPEGELPDLGAQAKVYFMPKLSSSLLSLANAKQKATSLGFSSQENQISQTLYRFPHRSEKSYLEMSIVTGAFSISFDLKEDSSPLERRPPAPEIAASFVRSYLSSADLLPDDLSGPVTHEFLKVEGGSFVATSSLSDSDLVRVYFFRKNYDELPSLSPDPGKANVWFLVSGAGTRDKQFVGAQFHYFPVDEGQSSTYPVKTAQAAWEELMGGGAFIANQGASSEGDSIKIRRVYLANFDAGTETEFFQPIIVFEGDKGFTAYVPAVSPEYYGE